MSATTTTNTTSRRGLSWEIPISSTRRTTAETDDPSSSSISSSGKHVSKPTTNFLSNNNKTKGLSWEVSIFDDDAKARQSAEVDWNQQQQQQQIKVQSSNNSRLERLKQRLSRNGSRNNNNSLRHHLTPTSATTTNSKNEQYEQQGGQVVMEDDLQVHNNNNNVLQGAPVVVVVDDNYDKTNLASHHATQPNNNNNNDNDSNESLAHQYSTTNQSNDDFDNDEQQDQSLKYSLACVYEEAEQRRQQMLNERKKRSREICEKAEKVAANHALKLREQLAKLREEIWRKQSQAAERRRRRQTELVRRSRRNRSTLRSKLFNNADDEENVEEDEDDEREEDDQKKTRNNKPSRTKVYAQQQQNEKKKRTATMNEKMTRSWRASFRACQRLVCVVAKSKLHNARAKLLAMRVKSARQLQSYWREMLRIKMIRDNAPKMKMLVRELPSNATFEETAEFINRPIVLSAAELLAKDKKKTFLSAHMIARHADQVLSVSEKKRKVLEFASKRLLGVADHLAESSSSLTNGLGNSEIEQGSNETTTISSTLASSTRSPVMVNSQEKVTRSSVPSSSYDMDKDEFNVAATTRSSYMSTKTALKDFGQSLDAYCELFNHIKDEDTEFLAEELFESLVQFRVLFEESEPNSEEKSFFESSFFFLVAKVKKLFVSIHREDKYKAMLKRCSREVKRRREDLNLSRRIAVDPSYQVRSNAASSPIKIPVEDLSHREWSNLTTTALTNLLERTKRLTPHRMDLHEQLNEIFNQVLLSEEDDLEKNNTTMGTNRLAWVAFAGRFGEKLFPLAEVEEEKRLKEWLATMTSSMMLHDESHVSSMKVTQWRRLVEQVLDKFLAAVKTIERDIANFHLNRLQGALYASCGDKANPAVEALANQIRGRCANRREPFLAWAATLPNSNATSSSPSPSMTAEAPNLHTHHREFSLPGATSASSQQQQQQYSLRSNASPNLKPSSSVLLPSRLASGLIPPSLSSSATVPTSFVSKVLPLVTPTSTTPIRGTTGSEANSWSSTTDTSSKMVNEQVGEVGGMNGASSMDGIGSMASPQRSSNHIFSNGTGGLSSQHLYNILADPIARVVSGDIVLTPELEQSLFDEFELDQLRKLQMQSDLLTREAHNHIVWRQIIAAYFPSPVASLCDSIRCGVSIESVLDTIEQVCNQQQKDKNKTKQRLRLSEEARQSLISLIQNQEKSTLRKLIQRRLGSFLTRFTTILENGNRVAGSCTGSLGGTSPELSKSKALSAMGMSLLEEEVNSLCEAYQRTIWVMAIARED